MKNIYLDKRRFADCEEEIINEINFTFEKNDLDVFDDEKLIDELRSSLYKALMEIIFDDHLLPEKGDTIFITIYENYNFDIAFKIEDIQLIFARLYSNHDEDTYHPYDYGYYITVSCKLSIYDRFC